MTSAAEPINRHLIGVTASYNRVAEPLQTDLEAWLEVESADDGEPDAATFYIMLLATETFIAEVGPVDLPQGRDSDAYESALREFAERVCVVSQDSEADIVTALGSGLAGSGPPS